MFDLATLSKEGYGWSCKCVCKSSQSAENIVAKFLSIVRQMNGNGDLSCDKYDLSIVELYTPDYDETRRIAFSLNEMLKNGR